MNDQNSSFDRDNHDDQNHSYDLNRQYESKEPSEPKNVPMNNYTPNNQQQPVKKELESHESEADSLYLQQLEFEEKDRKTWLNFFINNFRVTALIVIAILGWGLVSLGMLPLESNPEVKIPIGIISVALPGASPSDVEELIVDKIESKVANLTGVKQVTSSAVNSFGTVSVEFRAEEDLKDAIRRLRDAVDTVKAELPADATDPQVTEVSFSSAPVWTVVVTGPYDNFTLRKFADKVKDELEKLPGTNEVLLNGGDVYELRVLFDPQKLETYGLAMDQVNTMIRASNIALPLGTMDISNYQYTVRIDGKFDNAAELREIPVSTIGGQVIRLKDVATVLEMARDRDVFNTFSVEGHKPENAVTLNIVKKTGSSIITLIDDGKKKIEELKTQHLPKDLKIETTLDQSTIIRHDVNDLVRDGIITIILVTTILFLFVGLKEAFVAGLAVPLVFCATFGIMLITGITLNFLSLFSLILSLGLLVDDAIVVVQATKQYLKTGKFTPEEAVLLVFHDYKMLLTTTTLTTIWAFIPLLMATGIIGQFIRSIPITVSVTLAASYVIAIIINHPMAIILERFRITRNYFRVIFAAVTLGAIICLIMTLTGALPLVVGIILIAIFAISVLSLLTWYSKSLKAKLLENEDLLIQEKADPEKIKAKIRHHYLDEGEQKKFSSRIINGVIKLEKLLAGYGRMLKNILLSRAKSFMILIIVVVLFVISLSLPAMGILKSEFIPAADSEYLYVNIEGPEGLVTSQTKLTAEQVEQVILKENAIESFSLVIGAGGVNVGRTPSPSGSGGKTNVAQFAINLFPYGERPNSNVTGKREKSYDFAQRLRKNLEIIPGVQGAKISVVEVSGGPPSGADFEARIQGEDLQILNQKAEELKKILADIPGTVNEATSIKLSPGEFTLKLNNDQMQLRGITSAQIATTLRAALSGTEITKILRNGDELSVRAEFDQSLVRDINALSALTLSNGRGGTFRLGDVAEISLESSVTAISRIDEKRAIVVSAAVEKPHLPTDVLTEFQERAKSVQLPDGYEIVYGGQNDTNAESVLSILRAMVVAMILIVGTLVIQFNSFRKAILVLATIPLALTGVFIGLTLVGFTLTFPGLIGVLALFGIVVKNAVILVDKINLNLRVGIEFTDAIVDASKSRLEAIFLTSICTIFGMIPLTVSSETWQGLGVSLIFGLLSSTFLTLFVIPILYNIMVKKMHQRELKLRNYEQAYQDRKMLEQTES